jgi:nucleotide-binding universal stress UspA family protein
LAGARRIPTTVLHLDYASAESPPEGERQAARTRSVVAEGAETADAPAEDKPRRRAEIVTRVEKPNEQAIAAEAAKGYGLLFIGREPASEGSAFHEQIARSASGFAGPFAIAIARGADRQPFGRARVNILAPVTGSPVSRRGAELAIALAQAAQGTMTALHVSHGERPRRSWGRQVGAAIAPLSSADAIVREIVRLGDPYGVAVRTAVRRARPPAEAILRQLALGNHNLLVLGVSPRPGEELFFGEVAAELLERVECSILFVSSEPFGTAAAPAHEGGPADRTGAEAA